MRNSFRALTFALIVALISLSSHVANAGEVSNWSNPDPTRAANHLANAALAQLAESTADLRLTAELQRQNGNESMACDTALLVGTIAYRTLEFTSGGRHTRGWGRDGAASLLRVNRDWAANFCYPPVPPTVPPYPPVPGVSDGGE